MILVTVGSSLPFDRLIRAIDKLVVPAGLDDVFAQIGDSSYRPTNMRWAASVGKVEFDRMVAEAQLVISHAGMGTIAAALAMGKRVIVMPRRKDFGEVVNDHQVSTAVRFGTAGHVLVAHDAQELATRLAEVRNFIPKPRVAEPERVAHRVTAFLNSLVPPTC